MTDLQLWTAILGFFLPLAVAAIQQPKWSDPVRAVTTFILCVLTAAGTAYFQGALTGQRFATALLFVFFSVITAYRGLWKPSGATQAIENATSPGPSE